MKIEVSESQTTTASQTNPSTTPPPHHRQTASPRRSGQKSRPSAPRLAGGRGEGEHNRKPALPQKKGANNNRHNGNGHEDPGFLFTERGIVDYFKRKKRLVLACLPSDRWDRQSKLHEGAKDFDAHARHWEDRNKPKVAGFCRDTAKEFRVKEEAISLAGRDEIIRKKVAVVLRAATGLVEAADRFLEVAPNGWNPVPTIDGAGDLYRNDLAPLLEIIGNGAVVARQISSMDTHNPSIRKLITSLEHSDFRMTKVAIEQE
ncbi:MAG: hypothetical protein PHV34_01800 [Verrucomicrobiae bacterium]|nr:hypothetical protein [Verrucomicrobiae bacterium]